MQSKKIFGLLFVFVLVATTQSVGLAQSCCKNYEEFAARCTSEGGTPSPNPARCDSADPSGKTDPAARALGTAVGQAIACKLFGVACPGHADNPTARATYYGLSEAQRARLVEAMAEQQAADAAEKQRVNTVIEGGSTGGLTLRNLDAKENPAPNRVDTNGSIDSGNTALQTSRIDAGLPGARSKVNRDFSGPHSAWKELFCAASILGPAIASLNIDDQANLKEDYAGFHDLAAEAMGALNGQVRGVPCATAPDWPNMSASTTDAAKMIDSGKRLVAQTVDLAARLKKAREKKAMAEAEINKTTKTTVPEAGSEDPVTRQRAINQMRADEAARIAQAQRDFNEGVRSYDEAKTGIKNIQAAVEKAKDDPENYPVYFDEVAPPPVSTPGATTPKPPV